MSVNFIVGCSRSGTTSLLRALALSEEAQCLSEPAPNLNIESREMFEGRLAYPERVLERDLRPRVDSGQAEGRHYVEKQISLVPFMPPLVRLFDCRFVIPVRDGRDVVASLINWHREMYPIIYQECGEAEELGSHAQQVLERQQGMDPFDYSLPRPPLHDPWRDEWTALSRFEMVTWYWQYLNRFILDRAESLDPSQYMIVDYTDPDAKTIRGVYEFLGLTDFDERAVTELLARRINSLQDRIGVSGRFPGWREWPEERLQRFYDIAFDAMHRLGYEESATRPPPPGFGEYWREDEQDADWLEEIYMYREPSNLTFQRWFGAVQRHTGPLESVIELGCGAGIGYTDLFKDLAYTGLDLVPRTIEYCRQNPKSPDHEFICCDALADPPDIRADLVMSHATIDNVYDVDGWLRAMARMTDKVLYVSNYRGYFGAMTDHRYRWDPGMAVFFNDVSARRAERVLREEGFESVVVFPNATHREDIARETVIIASREPVDTQLLTTEHELTFDFKPYRARASGASREELIDAINHGCASFSTEEFDLANPLSLLDRVIEDVLAMPERRLGTVEALALERAGVNTALRVDVDMDLVAAVEMAEIARRSGVPLSFFLLHTAAYYGSVVDSEFLRNEALADLYLYLQECGCEVGLHTDALMLYLDRGIDGAAAVAAELEWLRGLGLNIGGTAAHNVAPVYGAENFEIFAERNIHGRSVLVRDHAYVPIGTLEESSLGLKYEAGKARSGTGDERRVTDYLAGLPEGDFLRDPSWFRTYLLDGPYCSWGFDYRIWLLGRDAWSVAGHDPEGGEVFRFGVPWADVSKLLGEVESTQSVCITLHPIYLGRRRAAGMPPEGATALSQLLAPEGATTVEGGRARGNIDKVADPRELDILTFAKGIELGGRRPHVARGIGRSKEFVRGTIEYFGFAELGRVIDLGCGYGRWSPFLAEVNDRVTGLDINFDFLRIARNLSAFFELDNVSFQMASLFDVPAASGSFDGAWIHSVSAWVERAALLREASRIVKPRGRVFVTLNGVGRMLQQLVTGYAAGGFDDPRVKHARTALSAGPLADGQPTYATRRVLPELLGRYGLRFDETCPFRKLAGDEVSEEELALLREPKKLLERFESDSGFRELAVNDCKRLMRGFEYDIWLTATKEAP